MAEKIQRVLVWPPILRILHLMMAATVLILVVTGLLLNSGMILNEQLYQHLLQVWHLPAGNVLVFVLFVRVVLLLVRRDVAGWRALIPDNFKAVIGTATFYLSMGRMNLPAYFAHNPLWQPVYLLWILLLLVQAFSGLLLESAWMRSVFRTDASSMLALHEWLLGPLIVMTVAHVITALLHDWKSQTGELSAINNGYKFFTVEDGKSGIYVETPVFISLDRLKKDYKKD